MVTTSYRRPPLRLTRRGRVVLLALFVVLSTIASGILLSTASRATERRYSPARTIVVQEHDTLWSIATRTSPSRDPYAAIAELREINDLDSYMVEVGQTLELPAA